MLLLHGAVRGLYDALANSGTFLIAGTRMGGHHGYGQGGARNPIGGAVVGFVKASKRERPEALVKAVDFPEDMPGEVVARALLDETERDPGAVEIDNGRTERRIRNYAVGRRNFLFTGSVRGVERLARKARPTYRNGRPRSQAVAR